MCETRSTSQEDIDLVERMFKEIFVFFLVNKEIFVNSIKKNISKYTYFCRNSPM